MGLVGDVERQGGSEVVEKTKSVAKRPQLFHVVLINDDYTTMEFVVQTLEEIFDKGPAEAYRIMMEVHTRGRGVCGAYTFEVAETKVAAVHDSARAEGFPLRAGIEEA
jgi:ATP-dependent Clp protease adaptor protein ClpS